MIPAMHDEAMRAQTWPAPARRSIVELIADGVLDAELAALAWRLIEARVPIVVGGLARGAGKSTLLEALLDFLPASVRRIDLAGQAEDFAWLPEAAALGWPPAGPTVASSPPVSPATSYLVAAELSEHLPIYTWGAAARTLVRAATIGYGIGATIHADRLEEVHDELRGTAGRLDRRRAVVPGTGHDRASPARAGWRRPATGRRRALRAARRPGRARPRPAPAAGRPRGEG